MDLDCVLSFLALNRHKGVFSLSIYLIFYKSVLLTFRPSAQNSKYKFKVDFDWKPKGAQTKV